MAVVDEDLIRGIVNIALPDLVIAQNIYYWQLDDPAADNPSDNQIVSACDVKLTAMYEDLEAYLCTTVTVMDVEVEKIEWDGTKWETVDNLGLATLGVVGDEATDMLPHGVAGVVTADTLRPQTRARKFIPGIAEDALTDSDLGGSVLAAFANYIIEWLTAALVTGTAYLEPAVVGQSGPSAGLPYLLIAAGINSIAGYQRRRKPGVGS